MLCVPRSCRACLLFIDADVPPAALSSGAGGASSGGASGSDRPGLGFMPSPVPVTSAGHLRANVSYGVTVLSRLLSWLSSLTDTRAYVSQARASCSRSSATPTPCDFFSCCPIASAAHPWLPLLAAKLTPAA